MAQHLRRGTRKGFSLVEMLFYVALLSLSLLAVSETLSTVARSYARLRTAEYIGQDAASSLDRIVRAAQAAKSFGAGSVFATSPGTLELISQTATGTPKTSQFYLSGGGLYLKENGTVIGRLTSDKTSVSNLVFYSLSTARSKGLKVEMTISGGSAPAARSEKFYATAILRDSY